MSEPLKELAIEHMRTQGLRDAITERERIYNDAIDRLRELATPEIESEVYDLTFLLREAIEMARCARRLLPGRTVREVHAAFGAPGDFGYHTPIGDALNKLYRGEGDR